MSLKFNHITDEQLAAFIDGNASESEANEILNTAGSRDDVEILTVSFSANNISEEEEDMPGIETLKLSSQKICFDPLPMAGFMGDQCPEDNSDTEK